MWLERGPTGWRDLRKCRVHVQVNLDKFSFGQPKVEGVEWCHANLLSATDVVVHVSMEPDHFCRLPLLLHRWKPSPRWQPRRPDPRGGGVRYGAVKNGETGTWQNRRPLGVIRVEQISLGDVVLAFEQTSSCLNVTTIGSELANGEVRAAARGGNVGARKFLDRKFNRLAVEIIGARGLEHTLPATMKKTVATSPVVP